jgi:DNA modification methylase
MVSSTPDLNFHHVDTLYATHGLHAFAAKCPPPLAAWAIERYTTVANSVCDPMMGSGTTLVEATLHGRHAIGFDLDPLACLISRAKVTPIDQHVLHAANKRLISTIARLRDEHKEACERGCLPSEWPADLYLPDLPRRDYWFLPSVQLALALLKHAITTTDAHTTLRILWYAAFSSLIVAQTSVANARDVVHSRHQHADHATPPDVFRRFERRLRQIERQMCAYTAACEPHAATYVQPVIKQADARNVPLPDASVDLILTSPPYCNALDYTRAHRFAVAWLADVLHTSLDQYVQQGRIYIGSERGAAQQSANALGIPEVDAISAQVAEIDVAHGRLVARYFVDMQQAISEIGRVLRPGGHAVIVVCPSNIRRITIDWHRAFSAIACRLPVHQCMHEIELIERTIDDRRRLLPYMNAGEQLAQRMRTEYVLVLRKECRPSGEKADAR